MDTSNEYIEMCSKATEIQKMREEPDNWENGDFFKIESYEVDVFHMNDESIDLFGKDVMIWLPRQDQLSELIQTWNKKYSSAFFQNIACNSIYRNIGNNEFDSIEKHLLSFYMNEQYQKSWIQDQKEWIEI